MSIYDEQYRCECKGVFVVPVGVAQAQLTAAQERTRRIVEAGDQLVDAMEKSIMPRTEYEKDALAAYCEAVGEP